MHHPWRRLRSLTGWTLIWDRYAPDLGVTDWAARTITMRPGGSQAQRRSTLAHELAHVERGPVLDDPVLAAREDRRCDMVAARALIDLSALISAAQWSQWPAEIAEECWVDLPTLQARVTCLSDSERARIEAAVSLSSQV